uniref:Uncharacterized protein n=1 Tax=Arundo donax TaxID=35708 RepID=A0A0A9GK53_ARUDO
MDNAGTHLLSWMNRVIFYHGVVYIKALQH